MRINSNAKHAQKQEEEEEEKNNQKHICENR